MNESNGTRSPWTESLARWLIRHAAHAAPRDLADRLEEEWLADLSARQSAASAMKFAIGCCWATKVIAFEHRGSEVALPAPAAHPKIAFDYFGGDSGPFSKRSGALLTVMALHAAVFYALLVGLGITGKKLKEPDLQIMRPVDEHRQPTKLDLPALKFTRPLVDWRMEEPPRVRTDDDDGEILRSDPPRIPQPQPPVLPRAVTRVPGGPGAGFPNTDDFYPSAAKRLEEQGLVAVQVCVDSQGRLTKTPTIALSSKSERLDSGALDLARAGSGHYRPNTEDNRPVEGCYPIRIRFQLRS